jgi:hypothetical protein
MDGGVIVGVGLAKPARLDASEGAVVVGDRIERIVLDHRRVVSDGQVKRPPLRHRHAHGQEPCDNQAGQQYDDVTGDRERNACLDVEHRQYEENSCHEHGHHDGERQQGLGSLPKCPRKGRAFKGS